MLNMLINRLYVFRSSPLTRMRVCETNSSHKAFRLFFINLIPPWNRTPASFYLVRIVTLMSVVEEAK